MKNVIILFLVAIVLIPFVHANAIPAETELVLKNIEINPLHPKIGEAVTILGEVYNAGKSNPNSVASIVTIGYFIDGKLLHIGDIGNIEPGIKNKIKISSGPIWESEVGKHTIKVVINYQNTLKGQYDSPEDNVLEKDFVVEHHNPTRITLDAYPQYGIHEIEKIINFTAILTDVNSNIPVNGEEIIWNLNGEEIKRTTNKEGKNLFSNTNHFFNTHEVKVFFEGNSQYAASNSSLTIHSLPKETSSSMIIKLNDIQKDYNFEEREFEIIIFQDSYQGASKKIIPDTTTLLDSKTLLVPLSPKHDYFAEIYLDGKIFSVTDKERLNEKDLIIKELKIPEIAYIKFKIINNENLPVKEGVIKTGIYSVPIEKGETDWIKITPIIRELYEAEVIFVDQESVKLKPFSVYPDERKIIIIDIKELETRKIPDWIKINVGWWAEGTIEDETFVQAMQFMIKEGILKV